jgi:heterodisulfide reductase subunit A-like polyferredoxin
MSRYFCFSRFIDLIKERYPKTSKLIIYFDLRKSGEKTKFNQLQLHPCEIVIIDNEKRRALDHSKLIEICDDETDDENTNTYRLWLVE